MAYEPHCSVTTSTKDKKKSLVSIDVHKPYSSGYSFTIRNIYLDEIEDLSRYTYFGLNIVSMDQVQNNYISPRGVMFKW